MVGCAETSATEGDVLGDPSSEEEKAAAEGARRQLEMGIQMGMRMMQEHLSRTGASPSEHGVSPSNFGGRPSAFGGHASPSGAVLLNVAEVEHIRKSMAAELAMQVPAQRRSTAHFVSDLQDTHDQQAMIVAHRSHRQSMRSLMCRQPPPGTWLVEIDDQVRHPNFIFSRTSRSFVRLYARVIW